MKYVLFFSVVCEHNYFYQDARGDQCDKCGKLINATELKVGIIALYNYIGGGTEGAMPPQISK